MVDINQRIIRTTRALSIVIASLVSLSFPASYGIFLIDQQRADIIYDSLINASEITRLINHNPQFWKYEEPRLLDTLADFNNIERDSYGEEIDELREVVSLDGQVIASNGGSPAWPTFVYETELYDSGRVVGHLRLERSYRPFIGVIAFVGVLGLFVGALILVVIEKLPLRALKRSINSLVREKDRASVTLFSITDGVITTDVQSRVIFMNPVAERLTGWTFKEAKGKPATEICAIVEETNGNPKLHPVTQAISENRAITSSHDGLLVNRRGELIPIEESAAPFRDNASAIGGAVLVLRDMSASREMAARLMHQASHDSLTGLINRREFESRLQKALYTAELENLQHVLAYIDVDQFKIVNDTCGHAAGDQMLRDLSIIIRGKIRASDSFARLGGDEFGLLLEGCPNEVAIRVVNSIMEAVQAFRFLWNDHSFQAAVSIGMVTIGAGDNSLSHVMSAADAACYAAKERGRNRVYYYQPGDKDVDKRRVEMKWVSRITKAIDENRFRLYFQTIKPLAAADTRDHFEILVRMIETNGDLAPPGLFIPSAERFNIMPKVDQWVIRNSFLVLHEIYGSEIRSRLHTCAINLSGMTWSEANIVELIVSLAKQYDIPPDLICFEVTETSAINNLERAVNFINELRRAGFRFALDDFGSGVSSFGYLKQLPVDYLKIDGSFVKNMVSDPVDKAMVESINQIGHIMGIKTIAEYAENDIIISRLREFGVDFAQGYGIDKPRPIWDLL